MKQYLLKRFGAKEISFEDFASNLFEDITMDRIGATLDFTLEFSNPKSEEERIEVELTFNYLYGEFIDVSLNEFIYYDENGIEYEFNCDLQIDLAFDKFIHENYSF